MGPSYSKKRTASSRRWFAMLATVEIQSVMRCLALKDLLAFARGSKQLLAAAASDFACANAILTVCTPQQNPRSLGGRVLDHCPLSVLWRKDPRMAHSSQASDCAADVDSLRSGRIARFDASAARAIPPEEWLAVLQCPAMQSLRCLIMHQGHFSSVITSDIVAALSAMPLLHTLHIAPNPGDPERFVSLPAFPSLTDLSISDVNAAGSSCLRYVCRCPGLRKLSVYSPALYGEVWNDFWAPQSPMHQLEELRIESYEAQDAAGSATVLDYTLLRWSKLKRLGLKECRHVDLLLPHLVSLSQLELLEIEPVFIPRHTRGHQAPSVEALCNFLPQSSCPKLVVRIVIQEGARRRAEEFSELVQQWRGRFEISTRSYWNAPQTD